MDHKSGIRVSDTFILNLRKYWAHYPGVIFDSYGFRNKIFENNYVTSKLTGMYLAQE